MTYQCHTIFSDRAQWAGSVPDGLSEAFLRDMLLSNIITEREAQDATTESCALTLTNY